MTDFRDDFLDGYYAECDEHLSALRQGLLLLEASVGRVRPDRKVTEELFRSFHSLKGLAGMVEDREAELLSHEMEGYLRAVRDGELLLSTAGVEALIEGTTALEQTLLARRRKAPLPEIGSTLEVLRELAGTTAAMAESPADTVEPTPLSAGWECIFTPSPELLGRGVNVDVVRSRLREIGQIVSAAPLITDQGVAFRFAMEGGFDAVRAAAWQSDGIVSRSLDVASAAAEQLEEPPSAERAGGAGSGHYVRVDLSKLDELMRMIGDMVILRARLADALTKIEPHVPAREWAAVQEDAVGLERQLRELREGVMRVRLVPVGEIFRRMPFVVRDLARESSRRINVELSGQATEIDKFVVERMMDPVLHLVRNAVSHGLEPVDERIAAGKPPDGTIRLLASASGDLVTIEIADDGRGLDPVRIVEHATRMGLTVPAHIDNAVLLDLISSPGFSTREQSDRASGRGVGMDVVRTTVEELGGSMRVESAAQVGTRFIIELPLTLAITDAFIARIGTHTFAIPQSAVREVIELDAQAIQRLEGAEVAPYRGLAMPVVRLSSLLNVPVQSSTRVHAFVVGTGSSAVGLIVDRVVGQREIVVRATLDPLIQVEGVAGATDLGDGRAVLILDLHAMSRGQRAKEIA